jgi:hypothetical protein
MMPTLFAEQLPTPGGIACIAIFVGMCLFVAWGIWYTAKTNPAPPPPPGQSPWRQLAPILIGGVGLMGMQIMNLVNAKPGANHGALIGGIVGVAAGTAIGVAFVLRRYQR